MENIIGKKFGRLTVIELHHKDNKSRKYFLCKCDCGNEKIINGSDILSHRTISCGCYNKENRKLINITHNLSKTKLYHIWIEMKNRCYNKNCKKYKNYGKRGITICKEWLEDFTSFYNWSYNNGYNENLTIDRIDVNGNYCPENCRWATAKEQARNKTNNNMIEYNNQKKCLAEWADILQIDYKVLNARINKLKWSIEKAFTTPVRKMLR